MTEQRIAYETAKLAKEKKFDIRCDHWYTDRWKNEPTHGLNEPNGFYENSYTAPTQALLQKWLREKHKIEVFIGLAYDNTYYTTVEIRDSEEEVDPNDELFTYFNTYEEALEHGLIFALNKVMKGWKVKELK